MSLLSSIFGSDIVSQQDEDSPLNSLFQKPKKRARNSDELPTTTTTEKKKYGRIDSSTKVNEKESKNDGSTADRSKIGKEKKRKVAAMKRSSGEREIEKADERESDQESSNSSSSDDRDDEGQSENESESADQSQSDESESDDDDKKLTNEGQPSQRTALQTSDDSAEDDEADGNSDEEDQEQLPNIKAKEQKTSLREQEDQQPISNKNEKDDSDDKEDVNQRTIFVGNLPNGFTRKALEKLFRPCGPIESTRIRSVPTTDGVKLPQSAAGNQKLFKKVSVNLQNVDTSAKPSVVGYVVFAANKDIHNNDDVDNTNSATNNISEAINKALQMNNTHVQDPATNLNRTIRVDHTKAEYDSTRSIFVGNLPYHTDEETLRQHFCQGCDINDHDIEGVRVVRDKESYKCKGFAYILFTDKSLVSTALRKMHQSTYMNREIRVLVCTKRYKSNGAASGKTKKKGKGMKEPKWISEILGGSGGKGKKHGAPEMKPGVAALRRILLKEERLKNSSKRARGTVNKTSSRKKRGSHKAGASRRTVAESKANKRVKKIQKRITHGMGKAKHG